MSEVNNASNTNPQPTMTVSGTFDADGLGTITIAIAGFLHGGNVKNFTYNYLAGTRRRKGLTPRTAFSLFPRRTDLTKK